MYPRVAVLEHLTTDAGAFQLIIHLVTAFMATSH